MNGEDALPDLALGRLPASSAAEARAMVEKILAWESGAWGLAGPIALVADNADGAGDFEADAEQVAQTLLADRDVERIYLSRLGGATRTAVAAAFDAARRSSATWAMAASRSGPRRASSAATTSPGSRPSRSSPWSSR